MSLVVFRRATAAMVLEHCPEQTWDIGGSVALPGIQVCSMAFKCSGTKLGRRALDGGMENVPAGRFLLGECVPVSVKIAQKA